MLKSAANRINKILGDRWMSIGILLFFVFESAWIAFSAIYPQAFDENFHFGLIQTYSHYWLPFLSKQPPGANVYGAVARDPSYLYHYLMSFPYRFIELFVHGQTGQVILMRLTNIGIFGIGLVLFRRVLLRIGVSLKLFNAIFFIFVLIPIVPQLAAQINYDNLIFPLVAWTCLLTFDAIDEIKKRQPSFRTLATLLIVCLLTSLVKYAFLPIFLGVVIFVSILGYRAFRGDFKSYLLHIWNSFKTQSKVSKTVLISLLIISLSLFVQRDGINLVKYHALAPNCASVLNVQDCSAYSVWDFNYLSHKNVIANPHLVSKNPIYYIAEWLYWMWYRLFFTVNGPNSQFTNYPPLPLPSAAAALIAVIGTLGIIKFRRRLFGSNPYIVFLLLISVLYILALLLQGYASYKYTAVLQNMNGRYLLPVLPLLVALAGMSFSFAFRKLNTYKAVVTALVMLLFLQGGGFLTFISRSDDTWDWPNSAVTKANDTARRVTKPVIVDGKKTYSTSIWFFN